MATHKVAPLLTPEQVARIRERAIALRDQQATLQAMGLDDPKFETAVAARDGAMSEFVAVVPFPQDGFNDFGMDVTAPALLDLLSALCDAYEALRRERERLFRIQDGPAIPWSVIAPCEAQALENHCDQSLEKLHSRGGLGVKEALFVLHCVRWHPKEPSDVAVADRLMKQSHQDDVAELLRIVAERWQPLPASPKENT